MSTPSNPATWDALRAADAELLEVWTRREAIRVSLLEELVREREYTGGWWVTRNVPHGTLEAESDERN